VPRFKSQGKRKWRHEFAGQYGKACTRSTDPELLLQSWNELSDSAAAAGWDDGDEISDDEESENWDEEFDLRMGIDSEFEAPSLTKMN
jgi:hypothetical protein